VKKILGKLYNYDPKPILTSIWAVGKLGVVEK